MSGLTGSSLMKKSSCEAGYDFSEVQRTLINSFSLYSGRRPMISGPDSGRTGREREKERKIETGL